MEKKINLEAKKVILIAFGILLFSFVYAVDFGSIPPIPDHFIGDVTINGQSAAIGTQISIYVDTTETVYSTIETGKYDLYVTIGEFNDSIEFKIQDKLAGTSTRGWGNTTYLDLSITTTPSSPPSSSGGGGGGGSGGGGGFVSPSSTTDDSGSGLEETIQTQEIGEQEARPGITGAVIGFLGSGKGIITIIIILILGIGVILIKFKTPKWKRKLP